MHVSYSTELSLALTTCAKAKAPAAPVSNGVQNGTAGGGAPADARESTAEQPVAAAPADPYAFLPPPSANNSVQTTVTFSDGRVMRIANTQVPTDTEDNQLRCDYARQCVCCRLSQHYEASSAGQGCSRAF